MGENTLNLSFILAGGVLIDIGFLCFYASKPFSCTAIILGAIIFWHGFRRLG